MEFSSSKVLYRKKENCKEGGGKDGDDSRISVSVKKQISYIQANLNCLSRHLKPSTQPSCCGVQPHGVSCRRCRATPSPWPRWPSPPMLDSYWLFPAIARGLYGDGTCPHLKVPVREEGRTCPPSRIELFQELGLECSTAHYESIVLHGALRVNLA